MKKFMIKNIKNNNFLKINYYYYYFYFLMNIKIF